MTQKTETGGTLDRGFTRVLLWVTRYVSIVLLLVVGLAIMLAELDRLVAGSLTARGLTHSLGDVLGPAALAHTRAWDDWFPPATARPIDVAIDDRLQSLIGAYGRLDLVFVTVAALALWYFVKQSAVARRLVYALAAAGYLQIVLLFVAISVDGAAWWLAGVVTAKWVILAGVLIAALRNAPIRAQFRRFASRLWLAAYVQRLSVVALLPLAILGLVPAADVLDQLPDAERTWVDSGPSAWQGVVAVVFTLLVSAVLFTLGRLRSQRVARAYGPLPLGQDERTDDRKDATYWWWCAAPVAAIIVLEFLVLGELAATGSVALPFVDRVSLVVFLVLFLLPVVISLVIRAVIPRCNRRRAKAGRPPLDLWSPPARERDDDHARLTRVVGDVLAGLVVTIGLFGFVRSFSAPLLLQSVVADPLPAGKTVVFAVLVAVGLVGGAVSVHVLGRTVASWVDRSGSALARVLNTKRANDATLHRRQRLSTVMFGVAATTLLALMIFPREISTVLGIVAICLLAIGCWSVILGVGIVQMQARKPMEVFRALHMRANPVLTLVVIAPLVISQFFVPPTLHAVQKGPVAVVSSDRPTLKQAFSTWLEQSASCDRTVVVNGTKETVRPLVVVAAAGGGIRAATWTANAFTELARAGDCASNATMLSSGTSGGSVGLSLFRDYVPANGASVDNDVRSLSQPGLLGGTVVGTFVGDNIAGLTGLRVPSRSTFLGDHWQWTWQDRAALMESAWQDTAVQLATPYDLDYQHPTGYLILNSTDSGRQCRVLISQIDLNTQHRDEPTICRTRTAELPASIDLIDAYERCPFAMDWATAAMLSARFPFVTPAGRVSHSTVSDRKNCTVEDMQLVDGGYFEASGLETISDLSPQLTELISDQNVRAANGVGPWVVPIVAFFDNGPGADVAANPKPLSAEVAVPLVGRSATGLQVEPGTWIQRVSDSFANVCPTADATVPLKPNSRARSTCEIVRDTVRKRVPDGVVVVAPNTEPSIEAPLGWTLSEQSRDTLCSKLQQQMDPRPKDVVRATTPYGTLGGLLQLLEPENPAYASDASEAVTPLCSNDE